MDNSPKTFLGDLSSLEISDIPNQEKEINKESNYWVMKILKILLFFLLFVLVAGCVSIGSTQKSTTNLYDNEYSTNNK